METMYYTARAFPRGRSSYCVKGWQWHVHAEGTIAATRLPGSLTTNTLPQLFFFPFAHSQGPETKSKVWKGVTVVAVDDGPAATHQHWCDSACCKGFRG